MQSDYSITYFDQVSAIGIRILDFLGGSLANDKAYYLKLVADIYAALAGVHDILIDVTIDVSQAQTMGEANQVLARVQGLTLADTLKAEHRCEDLGILGIQLSRIPPDKFGLTGEEKLALNELCEKLQQRELGTARLYGERLSELGNLAQTEPTLEPLKAKVQEISDLLVIQKADFEYLAIRAGTEYAKQSQSERK